MQSRSANRIQETGRRAVIKQFRRLARGQSQVDIDGMTLVCPDSFPVLANGKAFLIVLCNNLFQQRAGQWASPFIRKSDQLVDVGPAVLIQHQANFLRLVP